MHEKIINKGNRLLRQSLNWWSQQAGRKYELYDRRAKAKGIDLERGQLLTLREFLEIALGDKESEMIAKIRSERLLNECELREKDGQLRDVEEVKVALLEVLQSLKRSCFKLADGKDCSAQMENIWTEFNHSLCETLKPKKLAELAK